MFLQWEAGVQAVIRLPLETEKLSDHALIASIATGEKRAMVLLFMRHNVRIHRFVARLTGNASLADDVVNDAFLDVWRGANRTSEEGPTCPLGCWGSRATRRCRR